MDQLDRAILAELQRDGRLSATALAEKVGLTVAPCHRRIRELERSGVISGYQAVVDAKLVGLGFEALVFVTLKNRSEMKQFEAAVEEVDFIVEAQRLFGEPDFLLRVYAADLPSYQQLYDDVLVELPGVEKLTSTIVMRNIKDRALLPV
ncbi:Lrp/AsnC family transcriptional regulator [Glutamicibacter creatinolyticus]|uniref:DNA-binding Lrp family transcriptional regulator n=1 Tax=Glutamicibacter creatinolyticus TaxID=162496 RepID=A0A5B7WTH6_9MICC|nr:MULTISPECIES: Lrp/AsnC family transcriptional regulator [Micrococcaceae]QCY47371.1 DNA-binding Lrp family transcriptional regulator [Glutamicibacter creatinolyticus]TLK49716.1 Lrp/AsnC family transcriptional regulator [Glutamicibacter sp. V16R2B1]